MASFAGGACWVGFALSACLFRRGHLCMRFLQLQLRALWDYLVSVVWTPSNESDLFWWSDVRNLLARFSLERHLPDLLFWSDVSNYSWGANLINQIVSRVWSPKERSMSISWRELCFIHMRFFHFRKSSGGVSGSVFRQYHGPHLPEKTERNVLTASERRGLTSFRWTESMGITHLPHFIMGAKNVVADSLSHRHQVLGLDWTLAQKVVYDLRRM